MTVGEAMERAEELRPGSRVAARTRQRWLCEVDGMLREKFFRPSSADSREDFRLRPPEEGNIPVKIQPAPTKVGTGCSVRNTPYFFSKKNLWLCRLLSKGL